MHRRVYGRNGDVVILLCVIPPSTHPLLLIKFDKVFIAQIYFEIFKRPPIIFFFSNLPPMASLHPSSL